MAEMKGIKLCGECINYDWKKHKCKIGCNDDSNAQAPFYGDCPLPDVVPKSEVEMLQGALKAEELHNELTMETAKKALSNAKDEVAMEIFEEIERYAELQIESLNIAEKVDSRGADFFGGGKQAFVLLLDRLAELKKKYTEGGKYK